MHVRQLPGIEIHRSRFQPDLAGSVLERLSGIHNQIQHDLPEVRRISQDARDARCKLPEEMRPLGDAGLEQLQHLEGQTRNIDGFMNQPVLPRIGKQLFREFTRAFRGGFDLIEKPVNSRSHRPGGAHQLDVARDRLQQIVEIVGHAAGERGQCLELLRLEHARFESLTFFFRLSSIVNPVDYAHQARGPVVDAIVGVSAAGDPAEGAVGELNPQFDREMLAVDDRTHDGGGHLAAILGVNQLQNRS